MYQILHRAGDPWNDLTTPLSSGVTEGRFVIWMSLSGTIQLFALVDGCMTRTRGSARGSELPGDGQPLIVDHPFFATACGCGDRSGYRSTPPLLVALADGPTDVEEICELGNRLARQLVDDGFDPSTLPAGHPPEPCGAMYCGRITPEHVAGS